MFKSRVPRRPSTAMVAPVCFADLPADPKRRLEERLRQREYAAGHTIISPGDRECGLLIPLSGKVHVTYYARGRQAEMGRELDAGELFCDPQALDELGAPVRVSALSPTRVAWLSRTDLLELMASSKGFNEFMLRRLVERVRTLTTDVANLARGGSVREVHEELLRLARESRQAGPRVVIALRSLSGFLAHCIESGDDLVARELKRLRAMGVLDVDCHDNIVIDVSHLCTIFAASNEPPSDTG